MAVDKLVDSTQLDADLTSVANAIRTKGGTSAQLAFPSEFVAAINAIPTSGSGDGYVWQDADGYVHLSDEQGTQTIVEPLSVTQNGTYTAQTGHAYSPVTVNVSGGGGESVPKKQINFIDFDGTILYSYTATEWASVTALPSNPSHTGLTAQGWNWTKAQIDAQLAAMPDSPVWVGQMYVTSDGKTRLYIHLESGRLHPYLGICPNGTVVVDWGDGSATSTLTGTSLTTVKNANHTYASGGDYMITLTVSNGSFAICGSSNTTYLLRKDTTTTANISRVYNNSIKRVEMGANASIGDYAFQNCQNLAIINIPSSVTSIGTYAFRFCYSLASVIIPSDVTSIATYTFNGCESLVRVAIPSGVTSIGNYAFATCHSLAFITMPNGLTSLGTNVFNACSVISSIAIPSNVTSIGAYVFQSCLTLSNITIPSGVTSIGSSAFSTCFGLGEIHFKPTTPPTVSNSNAWTSIPTDCKIYVPTGTLSAYTSASNYPSSSTYTYIEE